MTKRPHFCRSKRRKQNVPSVKTSPNLTIMFPKKSLHLWPVEKWSVFNQAVRTNNDVEGWHGLLNRHAKKGNLSFYFMIALMHEQSRLTDLPTGSSHFGCHATTSAEEKIASAARSAVHTVAEILRRSEWSVPVQLPRKCSHLTEPASH